VEVVLADEEEAAPEVVMVGPADDVASDVAVVALGGNTQPGRRGAAEVVSVVDQVALGDGVKRFPFGYFRWCTARDGAVRLYPRTSGPCTVENSGQDVHS